MTQANELKIVVSDTNVFIDLMKLEILEEFSQIGLDVYTSEFVMAEIDNAEQRVLMEALVSSGKLKVDSADEEQLKVVLGYLERSSKLSLTDCAVLELAVRKHANILTSDRSLNDESMKLNIVCNGLLFVLELMVEQGLLAKVDAVSKLEWLTKNNKRAPMKECTALIEVWKA